MADLAYEEMPLSYQIDVFARDSVDKVASRFFKSHNIISMIPSITSYVYEIRAGDESYIAKLSIMGLSKATLAKEYKNKGIDALIEDQEAFLKSTKNDMQKEAMETKFLNNKIPGISPKLVAYRKGVMVQRKAEYAIRLQEALESDTSLNQVYQNAYAALKSIHRISEDKVAVSWISRNFPFQETKTDTLIKFRSKFLSSDKALRHIATLGGEEFGYISDAYRNLCVVISSLLERFVPADRPCVVFGDFKPENALVRADNKVILIDGEMHMGRSSLDIGRMVSRTSLSLLYGHIPEERKGQITEALKDFVFSAKEDNPDIDMETVLVCSMDMLNILSSYLNLTELEGYPRNVQENYNKRLQIIDKVKGVFGKGIFSLEDFIAHFGA